MADPHIPRTTCIETPSYVRTCNSRSKRLNGHSTDGTLRSPLHHCSRHWHRLPWRFWCCAFKVYMQSKKSSVVCFMILMHYLHECVEKVWWRLNLLCGCSKLVKERIPRSPDESLLCISLFGHITVPGQICCVLGLEKLLYRCKLISAVVSVCLFVTIVNPFYNAR